MSSKIVLLVLACGLSPVALAAPPQEADEPPTVTVTGTALTRVPPDVVVWHLSLQDEGYDLAATKKDNDARMAAVLALLDELDVPREDVQTGYANFRKEFDRDDRGNRTQFRGYSVDRGVTFRLRDLGKFDAVLTDLVSRAKAEVSYSLESSRMIEIRQQARMAAVDAARDKARAMVERLGRQLGPVTRLEEAEDAARLPVQTNLSFASAESRPPDVSANETTFAPGSLEVRVSVRASFLME